MGHEASVITFHEIEVHVQDFSLQLQENLPEGRFISLLGPSGSGKTTLLRSIAGFIPLRKGKILIGDQLLSEMPPHHRNLGLVFQDYSLFPHRSVLQNITYGLTMRKQSKHQIHQRADELLTMIRLREKKHRYPHELSGGEQQRVAVARAIAFRPQLLLMDEPLSALDAMLRDELRSELKKLQRRENISVLYVTHDYREALSLSDMVMVMENGRIRQIGSPQDVYANPVTLSVATLLGEGTSMEAQWKRREGALHCYATPLGEWYSSRCVQSSAVLFFRPEMATLSGKNRILGTVHTREFHGHYWRLIMEERGVQIIVYHSSDTLDAHLGVSPEDVLVFPKS